MPRAIKNILTEADLIATLDRFDADTLDRYAADLIGRAIGHEQAWETRKGLPPTMFYSNLLHSLPFTSTRKIMAFTSAREVQAL